MLLSYGWVIFCFIKCNEFIQLIQSMCESITTTKNVGVEIYYSLCYCLLLSSLMEIIFSFFVAISFRFFYLCFNSFFLSLSLKLLPSKFSDKQNFDCKKISSLSIILTTYSKNDQAATFSFVLCVEYIYVVHRKKYLAIIKISTRLYELLEVKKK